MAKTMSYTKIAQRGELLEQFSPAKTTIVDILTFVKQIFEKIRKIIQFLVERGSQTPKRITKLSQ